MWLYRAICNISTLSHISLYKVSIIMWHELVLFCEWVGFFLWFFFLYFPPFSQQFSLPPTNSPLSNDSYHPGRVKANILPSDISTPQPTARFRTAAHAALQGSVNPFKNALFHIHDTYDWLVQLRLTGERQYAVPPHQRAWLILLPWLAGTDGCCIIRYRTHIHWSKENTIIISLTPFTYLVYFIFSLCQLVRNSSQQSKNNTHNTRHAWFASYSLVDSEPNYLLTAIRLH